MARKKTPTVRVNVKAQISGRLREVRQELFGEHGGPELARLLGLPARTWYNYETGVTVPAEVLLSFIDLTGTNPVWLHTGEGSRFARGVEDQILAELTPEQLIRRGLEKLEDRPNEVVLVAPDNLPGESRSDFVAVPLVAASSLASRGGKAAPRAEGHILAYRQWIPHPRDTVALRLEDEAMTPILPAGSVVAIDRTASDPQGLQGRIVAAVADGEVLVRWLEISGRHLILRPNNPNRDHPLLPLDLDGRPASSVVLGQVVWSWSKFEQLLEPEAGRTPLPRLNACPPDEPELPHGSRAAEADSEPGPVSIVFDRAVIRSRLAARPRRASRLRLPAADEEGLRAGCSQGCRARVSASSASTAPTRNEDRPRASNRPSRSARRTRKAARPRPIARVRREPRSPAASASGFELVGQARRSRLAASRVWRASASVISPARVVKLPTIRPSPSTRTSFVCEPGQRKRPVPARPSASRAPIVSHSSPRITSASAQPSGPSPSPERTPGRKRIGRRLISGRSRSTAPAASSSQPAGARTCGTSKRPEPDESMPAATIGASSASGRLRGDLVQSRARGRPRPVDFSSREPTACVSRTPDRPPGCGEDLRRLARGGRGCWSCRRRGRRSVAFRASLTSSIAPSWPGEGGRRWLAEDGRDLLRLSTLFACLRGPPARSLDSPEPPRGRGRRRPEEAPRLPSQANRSPPMPSPRSSGVRRLASLFARAREPVFVLDPERRLAYVNPAWEALTGRSAEEVAGLACRPHGPGRDGALEALGGSFCPPPEALAGRPAGGASLIVQADGARLWRRLEFWPYHAESGSLLGVIGLVQVG